MGWASPRAIDRRFVLYRVGDADVYVDADTRMVRFIDRCELVISGVKLWFWERLVLADPFLMDRIRAGDYLHHEEPAVDPATRVPVLQFAAIERRTSARS